MNTRTSERFWRNVDKSGECWLWTGYSVHPNGNPLAPPVGLIFIDRPQLVHRVSWEIAFGPLGKQQIQQTCGQSLCVRPEHLARGRFNKRHSILSEIDRKSIRRAYAWRECTQAQLAHLYGVSQSTIYREVRGL